ncbi:MAG: hypothetical protein Q8O67_05310 [Deltaproteobacteria bacterium]|nr:hypothetical protein [Deltaproteobacteria bacterium]
MRIVLRSPSFTSLHKLCGEQLARGGLYLTKDLEQAQFAAVDVVVEAPDGERFELACEVMQVFAGKATALSIKPAGRAGVDALMAHAMKHPADGADAPLEIVNNDDDDDDDDDDGGEAIPADAPLALQVAAMTIAEKRQAGLHGGKDLRFLIIKDNNKTLHPFVLNNPAISIDEVEAISRMTSVNPEVLHRISKDYTRSTNIMRNLVKNPKTPLIDALACVEKLALSDVRAIAKGGSVKNAILMAARKRLAL